MNRTFSERYGYTAAAPEITISEEAPDDLRTLSQKSPGG